MRRIIYLASIAALALTLAGCGSAAGAGGEDANTQTATVDGLTIALEAPATPAVLEQAAFLIRLSDAEGQPVDGADVYLDLTMPAMPMGVNKPIAEPQGGGVYRAQGIFDMAGDWKLTVVAEVAGKEHRATFDAAVVASEAAEHDGH
jgi:nitrogen fixation protein FixH